MMYSKDRLLTDSEFEDELWVHEHRVFKGFKIKAGDRINIKMDKIAFDEALVYNANLWEDRKEIGSYKVESCMLTFLRLDMGLAQYQSLPYIR
jgi:hypothetical protein